MISPSPSGVPPEPAPEPPAVDHNRLLETAWKRQKTYSNNARRYQQRFIFLRTLLAALSVLVVILSVLEPPLRERLGEASPWLTSINSLLLLLPITIAALLAFSVKFDRGHNWILLRGNAEALKMEIYYYRTRVKPYDQNRDAVLAERMKVISERVKGSPVHQAAFDPYEDQENSSWRLGIVIRLIQAAAKGLETLFGWLWNLLFQIKEEGPKSRPKEEKNIDLESPEDYVTYRLEDQFNWYRRKAKELDRQVQVLQAGVYILGGVGTLLAASPPPYKNAVAITTALTGAFTNYLEFKRVEASLVGYNQAADALYDIRAWWYSLKESNREQGPERKKNFAKLVRSCEETIRSEHVSWLQDMQDKLSQLYGTGESDDDTPLSGSTDSPKPPPEPPEAGSAEPA